MTTTRFLSAGTAVLGLAAAASAQTPLPLTTGSFEDVNAFSGCGEPAGWHNLSNCTGAVRRTLSDGNGPVFVHSGNACIELKPTGGFVGFTTDTLNFATFKYYNPVVDPTQGDMVVSGWYYIPKNAPIPDSATIKLELRLPNSQIVWAWENFSITGHTNNQWVQFTMQISKNDMDDRLAFGYTQGWFPPGSEYSMVSILPCRYSSGVPMANSIFWDDIEFHQLPACAADFNGDGFVDIYDFTDFVTCFEGGDCPPGKTADFNGDGFPDIYDFTDFVDAFELGC